MWLGKDSKCVPYPASGTGCRTPSQHIQVLIPKAVKVPSKAKEFCRWDCAEDLEMGRLSGIIPVGPKHNHEYLFKVEEEEYLVTGQGEVTLEAEIGMMSPQTKAHRILDKARSEFWDLQKEPFLLTL